MSKQRIVQISVVLFGLLMAALSLSALEYSIQLNGDGQYANCGSSPDFNFSNALTVEAWIYPTDFKEQEHMNTIVAKTCWSFEYSHGWTFRYGSANRSLNFNMGGGAGVNWIDCKADGVLTLNTWQHVAATYDGAILRVYVNGTQVAAQAFTGGITNADEDLCIGTINNPADMRYMTGKIDEVRIWNAVRTHTEIRDNSYQNVTSPNLVAYYRMNRDSGTTLTDESGNGHTASLVGSPSWVSDWANYSLQLNGNGQYVTCGSESDFLFTNQLTVEAWIYPTDFKEEVYMNTIVAKTSWVVWATYGWTLRYGSSRRTLNFNMSGAGNTWIDCVADSVLTLNKWQHVAATYNGSAIILYVNGIQVATKSASGNIRNDSGSLCIGSINRPGDLRCMTGLIDNVRIWDVARSAYLIARDKYDCGLPTNLLAHYCMTDGPGTILTDNTGHGHTGSIVGTPLPIWNNTEFFSICPTVNTRNYTMISLVSATVNGTIYGHNVSYPIQHGFCWVESSIASLPNISHNRTQLGQVYSNGAFSSIISGLSPGCKYYVRAYAIQYEDGYEWIIYGQRLEINIGASYWPAAPVAMPATMIKSTGFKANWTGSGWYSDMSSPPCLRSYNFIIRVSTDFNFSTYVDGYQMVPCGFHDNTSNTTNHSFTVTGLAPETTYYYKIASGLANFEYFPFCSWPIAVTTLPNINVSYNTGNISGVRIFTINTDFGIDPPSPLVFPQGYSGTIHAKKDGYTWSLAEGSDSNVITNLSSDKNISFIGTYRFVDPANPGFEYIAEPDIQISAVLTSLEDLAVPLPPGDPGDAMVLNFSGTQESDITISVPSGTWYAIAYYDDPADGGLAWHHANPYPAMYPQSIVFADLPFAAKSNIPVVLGSQDTTLPVELSSFIAVAMGIDGVKLSWATQSETNLLGFSVLRNTSSLFSEAISVSCMIPAANSSQLTQYSWQDMEIYTQDCYYYWLQIHELDGSLVSHGPVTVFAGHPADPELPDAPLQTRLLAPFPNPFNPSTTVHYELKTPDRVSFKIYNCKGQLVATHSQIHTNAGRYSWVFQGMDKQGQALASGVYLCVMNTREKTFVNKMVLAK